MLAPQGPGERIPLASEIITWPALARRPRLLAARGIVPRVLATLRSSPSQNATLAALVGVSVGTLVLGLSVGLELVTPSFLALPLLFGALFLARRAMWFLLAVVAACLAGLLARYGLHDVRLSGLLVVAVTGLVAHEFARSREETGLSGLRGDSVLLELRGRLEQQGEIPCLPRGWHAEVVVRPAGGVPFAGDFTVSALTGGGRRLEVALVDVSGKGIDAGTRALLLSGALGGLLGSRDPADVLPGGNTYLVRQNWDEGFATAVHLVVDLWTGDYRIASAGHPPVAHFDAGSGTWSLTEATGPALGLLDDVSYDAVPGRLDPGDALLLYTDGLVEIPGRDLSVGIDKLLGEAERLVPRGFTGGAERLVSRVAGGSPDDRGLVLLWRG